MTHKEGTERPSTSTIDGKIQQTRETVTANSELSSMGYHVLYRFGSLLFVPPSGVAIFILQHQHKKAQKFDNVTTKVPSKSTREQKAV